MKLEVVVWFDRDHDNPDLSFKLDFQQRFRRQVELKASFDASTVTLSSLQRAANSLRVRRIEAEAERDGPFVDYVWESKLDDEPRGWARQRATLGRQLSPLEQRMVAVLAQWCPNEVVVRDPLDRELLRAPLIHDSGGVYRARGVPVQSGTVDAVYAVESGNDRAYRVAANLDTDIISRGRPISLEVNFDQLEMAFRTGGRTYGGGPPVHAIDRSG